MPGAPRLLNVGCGPTFHAAWVNLDVAPVSPAVRACDIVQGLPFADRSFDACYSSHVLEHLEPGDGARLLREMCRVLEPGGVVRIVVPDLELVVSDYQQALKRALAQETGAADDYDWMMIQLLDQSVRRRAGGAMADFWRDPGRGNVGFVVARAGAEAAQVIAAARSGASAPQRSLLERARSHGAAALLTRLRRRIARLLVHAVAGRGASAAFEEGLFRRSGEIHQWMYDRFSLSRALAAAGFADIRVCTADASRIPDFGSYELDVTGGQVRKPDSLFMEAMKPAACAA